MPLDAGQTRPWGGSATAACHPQGHRLPRAWPGQGWGAAPSLPAAAARAVECEGGPASAVPATPFFTEQAVGRGCSLSPGGTGHSDWLCEAVTGHTSV